MLNLVIHKVPTGYWGFKDEMFISKKKNLKNPIQMLQGMYRNRENAISR